jgi:hypothetical protein
MRERPKQKNRKHQVNQEPYGPKRVDRNHVHGFPPLFDSLSEAQDAAVRRALYFS